MASYWSGVATYTGTVIGAGILAIPFVVQQAGFWNGILLVGVIGLIMMLVNLMLGEMLLRTKGRHQLTGIAEKYLGPWGKHLMAISLFVGAYGALIAYIIGQGAALSAIFGGSPFIWSSIFFVIMSAILLAGINGLLKSENILSSIKGVLFIVILAVLLFNMNTNSFNGFRISSMFLPFGAVIFAFLGTAAIPEVTAELQRNKKVVKKALMIGSLIPIFAYALFAAGVIGVTGASTTQVATVGIGRLLGRAATILFNGFAALGMATAYLGLSFAVRDSLKFDYDMKKSLAWFLAIIVPITAILLGATSFIGVIEVAGALGGGLAGVLIILMHGKKGDRKPEYKIVVPNWAKIALIAFFIIGAIITL
jgi:amino acid permease